MINRRSALLTITGGLISPYVAEASPSEKFMKSPWLAAKESIQDHVLLAKERGYGGIEYIPVIKEYPYKTPYQPQFKVYNDMSYELGGSKPIDLYIVEIFLSGGSDKFHFINNYAADDFYKIFIKDAFIRIELTKELLYPEKGTLK